jgi:hypothetical protein
VRTSQSEARQWTVELSLHSAVMQRQRGRGPQNTEAEEPFPGNGSEDREDLVRALVDCEVCELAKLLYLISDTSCKCPINPIKPHL